MKVRVMNIFSKPFVTNIVNNKTIQNAASKMCNPKAFIPVIMLESTVIAGRTYHAYKRGGKTECRERAIDETLTSVFWLGIIKWLNDGMGWLIKQKGIFDKKGLPEIDIDLGSDAIRNPMQKAINNRPDIKNKLCGLKLTKILTSAFIGVYFCGIILPKFYQSITAKIVHEEKAKEKINNTKNTVENKQNNSANFEKITMSNFIQKTSNKNNPVSFGNAANFIHMLETNPIANLLTVDAGLFTGRAYSARNADERTEFLFRDCTSSFFYLFSTPFVYKGISKFLDKYKGKIDGIDANTANNITEALKDKVNNMDFKTFEETILGKDKQLAIDIAHKIDTETIHIKDFEKLINNSIDNKQQIETIIQNAREFINLRPECASKTHLTISEVINSIQGGYINNPKLMTKAVEVATCGNSQKADKYIPFKEIDKIKFKIQKYAEGILEYAKSKNQQTITQDILKQVQARNMFAKVGYTLVGMVVSAAFLSTIIPKIQYKITEMRTGNKEFPGIRDIK